MRKLIRVSLFVAGGIGVFFTVIHGLMFYSLASNPNLISPEPMGIQGLLETFNAVTLWTVAAMAYFSFRYPDELVGTSVGRALLIVFGGFYLVRIASELAFVGYSGVGSLVIIILCLLPALSYLVAAISPSRKIQAVPQV